jgi:hypothetical protein
MKRLREFDTVRVLGSGPEGHLTQPGLRAPRAGETGSVIEIREHGTDGMLYTVESVAPDGYTIWIADFREGELEWISSPGGTTP